MFFLCLGRIQWRPFAPIQGEVVGLFLVFLFFLAFFFVSDCVVGIEGRSVTEISQLVQDGAKFYQ